MRGFLEHVRPVLSEPENLGGGPGGERRGLTGARVALRGGKAGFDLRALVL
ncbi:hypothetical protein SDC9_102886 [bioreactor metagenome]|uniref:Uncharacterized protein n=1 Tax=bioreactor metagenome TaxID=1076179 RepID=A0A645ASN1_9ZZZZ